MDDHFYKNRSIESTHTSSNDILRSSYLKSSVTLCTSPISFNLDVPYLVLLLEQICLDNIMLVRNFPVIH
jgi:hypothetical protein